MNRIPDKIKIAGITYDVIQKNADDNLKPSGTVYGEIVYDRQKIVLEESAPKEFKECCLVHELVHGILYAMARHDLRSNEQFVEGFAQQLYQVMKDNKLCFND
jgi:hypothetical protein